MKIKNCQSKSVNKSISKWNKSKFKKIKVKKNAVNVEMKILKLIQSECESENRNLSNWKSKWKENPMKMKIEIYQSKNESQSGKKLRTIIKEILFDIIVICQMNI